MPRETKTNRGAEILKCEKDLLARGLISAGGLEALERFRNKLESKVAITYAAIGGSITQGAAASDDKETAYVSRFATWLRQKTICRPINAGIGATTSMFGAFRAQREILCHAPDIITIEFAVNDTVNPDIEASYEALVRQCVASPANPLVILIFTMRKNGTNLQDRQIPTGYHYKLPMLSYRDALYPEVSSGKLTWGTISPDEVHPNDEGHAFIAKMLEHLIESANASQESALPPDLLYPAAAKYLNGNVCDALGMKVLRNEGWSHYDHGNGYTGYESSKPGSRLQIKVHCKVLLIGYVKYSGNFGMVAVRINGKKTCILDGFYEKPEIQKWAGGHTVLESLQDEPAVTEQVIEIELLHQRHARSNGHHFQVGYLLAGK